MTRFLLIRHGTTAAVGQRLSGRAGGVPLNDKGRRDVEALTKELATFPISHIYSSPMERALQTAEPLGRLMGSQVIPHEALNEIDFGDWTGRTFEQLSVQTEFQRFNTFRSCAQAPGGESMQEAQTRITRALQALALKHPNELVAVISHSDIIKAAVAYYAGIHLDLFHRIEISPASVSIIELGDERVHIHLVNYTGGIEI